MAEHLFKNWIVYVLLGGFVWFVIYTYVVSHKDEKKNQEQENSKKSKGA